MKKMLLFCFLGILLAGCTASTTEEKPIDATKDTLQTTSKTSPNSSDMKDTLTEFSFDTTKEGSGKEAKFSDEVTVHYVGTFLDGKVFDSSREKNRPFTFVLGAGMVIQGWDEGVVGMKVGEIRTLRVPYDMAYGDQGFPPVIPPKTPLLFEVELLEIN